MANQAVRDFFDALARQGLKVTYDDVRLETHHSEIVPIDACTRTRFSRRIKLGIPIVSSPMDTVTEAAMAIAMAEAGGLGIIHRGLSPEAQAKAVSQVKHRMNGLIGTPRTVRDAMSISDVLAMQEEMKREKKNLFSTFPVIDEQGKVVGLLTGNDLDLFEGECLSVSDVMTCASELTKAPPDISREEAMKMIRRSKKKVLPLISEDGTLAGMYLFSDLKRILSPRHDHNLDLNGQLVVGAAIGVGEGALKRAELLARKKCDVFVVDTAHGDSANVLATLETLRKNRNYDTIDIAVGNVSNGRSAKNLALAGADAIIVGQGPGSICTTRPVAGVGTPQVSAIYDCVSAIEDLDVPVPIIADGGIRDSGDIVVALALGASAVILGSLLAGTDESPGESFFVDGRQYKYYRGMGSLGAMRDNKTTRDRYGQSTLSPEKLVPEGVEGRVIAKGPVHPALHQYVGGVRAGMGYNGARTIAELSEKAVLFRITPAGVQENHPHDITITAHAPNHVNRR